MLFSCLSCCLLACAISGGAPYDAPRAAPVEIPDALHHQPLDPQRVRVLPEGRTVEQSWILDLYTLTHARNYDSYRVLFPDQADEDEEVVTHLLVPPGPDPHPAIVVFPILAGSHIVSETLSKALVRRGYAVLRMERRALPLEEATHPDQVASELLAALLNGRRALDWLEAHPRVDADRLGSAGVSLGGLLACLLHEVDPRVRAGFFALAGGGISELLYDSREKPVRAFRDRMIETRELNGRASFLGFVRPHVEWLDPLRYAGNVEPETVFMVNGAFDRVMPGARADALWQALGQPLRVKLPSGHYQALPFLWYAAARGADHFDRALAPEPSWRP